MKRIVVAGSRNFDDYTVAKNYKICYHNDSIFLLRRIKSGIIKAYILYYGRMQNELKSAF